MSNETEIQEGNVISSDNKNFVDGGILQLRLNTEPVLHNLELYLNGTYERYVQHTDGRVEQESVEYATPKCNPEGIYSIMSWLRSTMNSQIVQGNFETFDELFKYLENFRMQLAEYLMINLHKFKLLETDFEGIVDMVITTMHPFMSRLVGNKERDSYTHTLQHSQRSDTVVGNKKSFPFM